MFGSGGGAGSGRNYYWFTFSIEAGMHQQKDTWKKEGMKFDTTSFS